MGVRFEQTGREQEDIIGGEQYANRHEARQLIAKDPTTYFPHAKMGQEIFILDDGDNAFTLQSITGETVTDIRFVDNIPVRRLIEPRAKVEMFPR